jgi:signal transduction histidine kinase
MDGRTLSVESRRLVENTFDVITRTIAAYVPVLDSANERERMARLRAEIDEFKHRMVAVLDKASAGSAAEARTLLRTQVVPKRQIVIGLSEEIRAINRDAFVRLQAEVAEIYAAGQRWLWGLLSLAIVISFGIALVATRYASRLESRLQQRAIADAANATDLKRLSAKLITTQEEERRTIARELHDEIGQSLSAIKVELAVADRALRDAGVKDDVLESARSIADGTLATVRDLSHLLRPPMLEERGLVSALRTFIERFGRRHQTLVDFDVTGEVGELGADAETSIYRMVQEALTNVGRHARATHCHVRLSSNATEIRIVVEDDGVGCDLAEINPQTSGLGLVGIRERARQLGGSCEFRRNAGAGMTLVVAIPTPASRIDSDQRLAHTPVAPSLAVAHE